MGRHRALRGTRGSTPELLRYSWQGAENERPTEVTYRIEPRGDGTRLTYLHTGFSGIAGQIMSRLLGRVRRKMLDQGLPAVLAAIEPTQ
jgi:carbon monoxide dehydrogenase subunit G